MKKHDYSKEAHLPSADWRDCRCDRKVILESQPFLEKLRNLYETSIDNQHIYTAYIMEFCEGRNPESQELTDELVHEWGKITGKSHKVTKEFTYIHLLLNLNDNKL